MKTLFKFHEAGWVCVDAVQLVGFVRTVVSFVLVRLVGRVSISGKCRIKKKNLMFIEPCIIVIVE